MRFITKNKVFKYLLNILALIYLITEEVYQFIYNKLIHKLEILEVFEKLKIKLKTMNSYKVLFLMLSVLALAEAIGLYSFYLLGIGQFSLFLIFYIVKFLPFFVVSFIFSETKDELLKIRWFNFVYSLIMKGINYLKETDLFLYIKKLKNNFKEEILILKDRIKKVFNNKRSVIKEQMKFLIKKYILHFYNLYNLT